MLKKCLFALLVGLAPLSSLHAAAIAPGNLAIYRVGSGTGALANTGNPVFIDEYTPTGVLVQSIPVPTTAGGGNNPLISGGTASSEGFMTLSTDGKFLVFAGYNATLGGSSSLQAATSATVNRAVGTLNVVSLAINTSTSLNDYASGQSPRGVASTNGTDLWVTGGGGGIRYATVGSTTSTQLSTTSTNLRAAEIFGGQLYTSSASGAIRVATVGTGTPTTSGQTITNLPGFPTTGSPYAFFFADLDVNAGLDTLYVAEETTGGGQIQKYSLVSGNWTATGTATATAVRGLTGSVSGGVVTLYGTTGGTTGTGGGSIYSFVDSTGYNAAISGTATTVTTLAANSNTAFRGIAIIPVPEPGSIVLAGLGALGIALVMRRKTR